MPRRAVSPKNRKTAKAYDHKETEAILRPDIGIQAQFKQKREPAKYRYDRSLDPQLSWDINADREHAEALIEKIRSAKSVEDALAAGEELKFNGTVGSIPCLSVVVSGPMPSSASTLAALRPLARHNSNASCLYSSGVSSSLTLIMI
jgi:hypothetical protein